MNEITKEKKRQATKSRYHELKEKGLCTACGFRKPSKTSNQCDFCKTERKERQYERRLKLIEEGRCVNCGKDKGNSETLKCFTCNEKNRIKTREYQQKQKDKINEKRRETYRKKRGEF